MVRHNPLPVRRGCIWCGNRNGPWTEEHAIAQWISRALRTRLGQVSSNVWLEGQWHDVDSPRAQPTTLIQLRYDVCEGCNGGWMNDLEQAVMTTLPPLIFGDSVQLGVEDQTQLAAWAMKTLVTLTFMAHRDADEMFPPAIRDLLRITGTPPSEVQIVAARIEGLDRMVRTRAQDTVLRRQGGSLIGTRAISTVLIHQVAFQITHDPRPGVTYSHGAVEGGSAATLWPVGATDAAVDWPPPKPLTPEQFGFLADPPHDDVETV